jgi:serine/threonine protein kinase
MSLAPGTRIGSYEVVSIVGAGGMGEVYRARDTRLRRDVGVKVLPAPFADDAERLARFEREAQVLASLNHPHIAAIHGFEEHDGIRALVLEFVEGETLADRIVRGAMPLDEALPVARQIAEALEAAHEHGIVHRDLKPANIKITPDGVVKVLDFGLAKLADPPSTPTMPSPLSMSPTITSPALMTQAGMLLGTAAYMAPEQAKGKPADKRSDIWAFGTVLYEMLTGRRAFGGDDVTDTLAAVMKDVPKYALSPRTPRRLRHLLERCLERDVKIRLRDIGEARIELAAIEAGKVDEGMPPIASRRAAWLVGGVIVGAALTAAAMVIWAKPPSATLAPRARLQVILPDGVQLSPEAGGATSVSPDGRLIVFAASSDKGRSLWLRPVDADDAKPLPGTEGGTLPFWSPDSAAVGFFAGDKLKRLTISTGTVAAICGDISRAPGGGAWNGEGLIVFSPQLEGPLFQVSATGGTPKPLTSLDEASHESNHIWPAFLPDGRHYLYQANAGIYIGALGSTDRTLLIRQESLDFTAVQYSPSGHLVYVRNHQLVARPFDLETRTLTGDEFPLAEGFGIGGPGRPAFGVSQTGVLVYRRRGEPATYQVTWVARDGTRQGTVGSPGPY